MKTTEEWLNPVVGKLEEELLKNKYFYASKIEGARFLHNQVGTAPGMYLEYGGKKIEILPGPPKELQSTDETPVQGHNILQQAI